MRAKDALGRAGEQAATDLLLSKGFVVLDRNWRCPYGEIDIVATVGDVLVVCEVKTRSSTRFGSPAEAVTPVKLARLRTLAHEWVRASRRRWPRLRIDVVGVLRTSEGWQCRHLEGVG